MAAGLQFTKWKVWLDTFGASLRAGGGGGLTSCHFRPAHNPRCSFTGETPELWSCPAGCKLVMRSWREDAGASLALACRLAASLLRRRQRGVAAGGGVTAHQEVLWERRLRHLACASPLRQDRSTWQLHAGALRARFREEDPFAKRCQSLHNIAWPM